MSKRTLVLSVSFVAAAVALAFSCKSMNDATLKDDGFVAATGKPVVDVREPGQTGGKGIFNVTGMGVSGQTEIVWDIVSRDVLRAVDCSKLRYRRTVSVVNGGFSFAVDDSSLFNIDVQADPEGFRKLEQESLMAFQGPLRGEFCVKDQTQVAAASRPLSGDGGAGFGLAGETYEDVTEYAKECVDEVGYLPPFSCLDGQPIPIMVNGVELTEAEYLAQKPKICDNPVHLGLDKETGQCVPYARLIRLKTFADAAFETEKEGVDTVVICRRYKFDAKESPLFQDVAVVQHNKRTGATCWFQMLDGVGKNATRVPPPHEKALPEAAPATAQQASTFWMKPSQTVSFPCVSCHDSDPFMHSPYVMKVKGWGDTPGAGGIYARHYVPVPVAKPMMPTAQKGKYYEVGKGLPFKAWPKSYSITAEDTTCIDCHRIGSLTTCKRWVNYATGREFPEATSAFGKAFPLSHWMPASGVARFSDNTHGAETLEDWNATYGAGTQAILDCCKNPQGPGCASELINKRPY